MVYRGKPSAGCHECRKRRIKCDQKLPGCTQCSKISIVCQGYRNPLNVLFRDESETVVRKAEATYKIPARGRRTAVKRNFRTEGRGQIVTRPPLERDILEVEDRHHHAEPCLSVKWHSLFQPIGDHALAYFMLSYVPGSQFEYLAELYGEQRLRSPLYDTVHAVSLAIFSRELEDSSVLKTARCRYSQALAATNVALTNTKLAVQDSTLVAILLLRLFEAIVSAGIETPTNWKVHTNGALALVRLRGIQQFESELGRRLFHQIGNNIRIDCIQRSTRLPPEFVKLYELSRPYYGGNDPRIDFAALNSDLIELIAVGNDPGCVKADVVQSAMRLDERYLQLMKSLPESWLYRTRVALDHEHGTFDRTVHQYPSQTATQIWSSYRMIRILLNEIRWHCSDEQAVAIRLDAKRNIREMAREICISASWVTTSVKVSASGIRELPAKASVATLLWPLSVVRGTSLASEELRLFAIEQLKFLGNTFKLPQAIRVASASWELESLQDGLHMFYGS